MTPFSGRTSPTTFFRAIRQPDPPPGHHFDDEHLDAWWEAVDIQELLQEGIVQIVISLLEVIIQFNDSLLSFPLRQVPCEILEDSLLASLGGSDTTLLTLKDAILNVPKTDTSS